MAEEKQVEVTKEKSVEIDDSKKTPEVTIEKETTVAPVKDETTEAVDDVEAPDAEDFSDVINLLNTMDVENGGKGEISEVPGPLQGSIKYLVDQLIFVRDVFEDPTFKALLDDMADQKADGKTPSMMVAIARNIPMERIQELADNEDYAGMQSELANELAMKKSAEDEEAMYQSSFDNIQAEAQAYADEMGYDEARKNELLQKVFDILQIFGDGKMTKNELAEFDKMINYDPDMQALREQIPVEDKKEMLPDQASIESAIAEKKNTPAKAAQNNVPGLGSIAPVLETPEYMKAGKRRFTR